MPTAVRPNPAPSQTKRSARMLVPGAVFALVFLAFLPAISAGWSDYDDPLFLLNNPHWRGLSGANLRWMFLTPFGGHYQPLTYVSYAVEYVLFHTGTEKYGGTDTEISPAVLHTTNILIHALNAVLVLFLTRRVLRVHRWSDASATTEGWSWLAPCLAALLWGLHPLRVESVAWITERRDVLSTTFLLGAAIAYLRSADGPSGAGVARRWWLGSIALLLLSLLCKAWGITFVAIALLLDIYPLGRLPWKPWAWWRHRQVLFQKVPYALLGLCFGVIAAIAQRGSSQSETIATLDRWGLDARVAQAFFGLWYYLRTSIWPDTHALLVELPRTFRPTEPRWVIAFVAVGVIGALVTMASRRRPGVGAAFLAYVVLVSPVLGVLQSGIQLVAERYSYVAMIPLSMLLAAGIFPAATRPADRPRVKTQKDGSRPHPALAGAALCVCLVLAVLTWRQCRVWQSPRRLWEQAIASGAGGPLVHNYLGRVLEKQGDFDGARAQYTLSLQADPTNADCYLGIGMIEYNLGRDAEAEHHLLLAEKYAKDPMAAQLELGLLYHRTPGKQSQAIDAFQRAVDTAERLGPLCSTGLPYLNLASEVGEAGQYERAFALLQKALRFKDTRDRALDLLRQMQGQ